MTTQTFVTMPPSASDRLRDAEVTAYFMGVLDSDLPAHEKYQKFVQFFDLDARMSRELATRSQELVGELDEAKVEAILANAAEKAGVWRPQEILSEAESCLRRAINRLLVSQHRDGGWGFKFEQSSIWATAHGVLSLYKADQERLVDSDLRPAYERGISWLVATRADWSVEEIPPEGERNVYELSTVIRCLTETDSVRSSELETAVAKAMEALVAGQNTDGGWDVSLWGVKWPHRTRVWSETGATSLAIQALAFGGDEKSRAAVSTGIGCLVRNQNDDGSWNVMISREGLDRGERTVTKTCDALKAILAGRRIDIDLAPYKPAIAKGLEYLQKREAPFFDEARLIAGWGWHGDVLSALENTCHTLETLLEIEEASLPMLTANASWLIRSQLRAPGDPDDGKWVDGDTPRITLSLLHFLRAIKASPLFKTASSGG